MIVSVLMYIMCISLFTPRSSFPSFLPLALVCIAALGESPHRALGRAAAQPDVVILELSVALFQVVEVNYIGSCHLKVGVRVRWRGTTSYNLKVMRCQSLLLQEELVLISLGSEFTRQRLINRHDFIVIYLNCS